MPIHLLALCLRPALVLFLVNSALHATSSAQSAVAQSPQTTFVYFQRTNHHVKLSTPDIFDQVVTEFREYLSTNRVAAMTENNVVSLGTALPLFAVQDMAHDSGSAYLLYVTVDRPLSKWLKVTVRCYDSSRHVIWQEEASAGSGFSSRNVASEAMQELREKLHPRLGQPGLPQSAPGQQTALATPSFPEKSATESSAADPAVSPPESQPAPLSDLSGSAATLHLANGTPIHLVLAESISSKSATEGGTVKLQVLGDVKVGDLVVIANKAPATATIESAKEAGRAWRKGNLLLKLGTVTLLNQQQQPLRAWSAVAGKPTGAGEVWANAIAQTYGLALFFLPFAPLQHGNEAILPRGALLEAAISGDVQLSQSEIAAVQPEPAPQRHGPASVTFYNQDLGEGRSTNVWCGQVHLGLLQRGGKFTVTLPPGKYWLRPWNSKRSPITELDLDEGEEYYVAAISRSRRTGTNVTWLEDFSVVPHDVGELASADTVTSKTKKVADTAKLDLAQLQSDPRTKKSK